MSTNEINELVDDFMLQKYGNDGIKEASGSGSRFPAW